MRIAPTKSISGYLRFRIVIPGQDQTTNMSLTTSNYNFNNNTGELSCNKTSYTVTSFLGAMLDGFCSLDAEIYPA